VRRGVGGSAWNLALGTVAFALCFTAWSLIAPFAKTFKADLGLNYTQALLLTAVPVLLGSLLRIPMGVLTDRYGGRRIFAGLLALSALPVVLFGYADTYWALIAVGFALGVAGSSFAVGIPFVASWYPRERQGFALGVYGIGNVGTAIAFFGAPAVVDRWGRPALGWATAIVLVAASLLFYSLARNPPRAAAPTHYRQVLRSGWRLYRLAFFYFITFGGFVAMAFLLPTLLQDWFDYSKGEASARAAGFIIAATIARPIGGWLSDRVGAYPVLVLAFAGIAIDAAVLAALAPSPRIVPVTIACLSLGTFLGAGNGAVFKLVPAEFPNDAGAAGGVVGAAGGLGGFFPPVFVGLVKDVEGTYTYGFVGLLVFVAVCLTLAVWLLRSAPLAELRGAPSASPHDDGSGPLRLQSGDPLFSVDEALRIVTWNPAAERLIGIPAHEAVGRACWEVLEGTNADGRSVCRADCEHARRLWTEPVESPELTVRTAQGTRRVTLSTVGVTLEGQRVLMHTMRELPAAPPDETSPDGFGAPGLA
jgi:NNP family nitrate/nitrite transporter-like MFS transporter